MSAKPRLSQESQIQLLGRTDRQLQALRSRSQEVGIPQSHRGSALRKARLGNSNLASRVARERGGLVPAASRTTVERQLSSHCRGSRSTEPALAELRQTAPCRSDFLRQRLECTASHQARLHKSAKVSGPATKIRCFQQRSAPGGRTSRISGVSNSKLARPVPKPASSTMDLAMLPCRILIFPSFRDHLDSSSGEVKRKAAFSLGPQGLYDFARPNMSSVRVSQCLQH